jgi:hypothetical protein
LADGKQYRVATWTPSDDATCSDGFCSLVLPLVWRSPELVERATSHFERRDTSSGGHWKGQFGRLAAWIPQVTDMKPQDGYRLETMNNALCTWENATDDRRALESPAKEASGRVATCWHNSKVASFAITPPDRKPYRLSVYLLDFDKAGRAMEAEVRDAEAPLDRQAVSQEETARGTYLTWTVSGKVKLALKNVAGANAVVSGVFIDPVE